MRALGRWALAVLALPAGLSAASSLLPGAPGVPASAAAQAPSPGPAHEWLVDERGRAYRIERIDKRQPHLRLEGNRLRIPYGLTLDLAGEDERYFLAKVYRHPEGGDGGPVAPAAGSGPAPDDKARIAASYAFELGTSRTLAFDAFDEGLPRSGQWRYGFALADMNGDGHLDIVHGPPRRTPGPPVIFLGDGAGHWRRWSTAFPAQRYDYGHVAVADFDGDGHLDLAIGMHLMGIGVLLGDGAGRFRRASQGLDPLDPRSAFSSHALVAVDWDGDGHVDVVGLGEGPRLGMLRGAAAEVSAQTGLVLYRNRGDATWQKTTGGRRLAGDTLVLAQSRPDGRPWLVAGSITAGQSDLVVRPGNPFSVEALPGLRPVAVVRAVALADFDGDGREDAAVGFFAYEGGEFRSGIDFFLFGV
jgi:hypothetical protein